MNKIAVATAVLSTGLLPGLALAAVDQANPGGPYVGVGWGQMNLNIHNFSDVGTATSNIVKSKDNAWKLFAGYRINPYLAVEVAYIDFGKHSDRFSATGSNGNYQVKMSGFAPYIIGSVPLGNFDLFAKAGSYFYSVKLNVDFDNPGPDLNSSHSRNDFLYGGGLGYTVADLIHLRAEYEVVDVTNAKNSDAIWLSAAWHF
jgi:opacity protein-like surface antigen